MKLLSRDYKTPVNLLSRDLSKILLFNWQFALPFNELLQTCSKVKAKFTVTSERAKLLRGKQGISL